MTMLRISGLGDIGLIKDVAAHVLKSNAWTQMDNVRCIEGRLENALGWTDLYGVRSNQPLSVLPYQMETTVLLAHPGTTKCYASSGSTEANITRQSTGVDVDYTAGIQDRWNGGVLNGVPILNNGQDVPQQWPGPSLSDRLEDLPNWPSTLRARVVRPFGNFLFALNVTDNGAARPYSVYWSDAADPGAVPSTWTSGPDNLAGSVVLGEDAGVIVDGASLGNSFIVYKENSCYVMQFVRGNQIFRTDQLFPDVGLLAQDCVVQFHRQHFVVTANDIVVHNGSRWESVLDDKLRRWLFQQIDGSNYGHSFCVAHSTKTEIWFCYPKAGNMWPNKALVYNWRDGTLWTRDIPSSSFGVETPVVPADTSLVYADQNYTYADPEAERAYGWQAYNPSEPSIVFSSYSDSKLYEGDMTNTADGSSLVCMAQRVGLSYPGERGGGPDVRKNLVRFIPRITSNGPVRFRFGEQEDSPEDLVAWGPYHTFDPETDYHIPIFLNAHFFALEIKTEANIRWQFHGYTVEVNDVGFY